MEKYDYNAIVIGSGISGGWAAKELTEKGLKTLMLERGKNIEHITGYDNTNKNPWDFPHRGGKTRQMIKDYPVLNRDYTLNETNLDWWANEKDCPYVEQQRFDWFRGYHVGGRSLLWGRHSYRHTDIDFEANAKDGIAVDWPIRYSDIEKWYSYAEKFIGVNGQNENNFPGFPDGSYMPAIPLNCVEKDMAERIKKAYGGKRIMSTGRTANITQPLPGRNQCQYRNKCWLGCPFGAYFSTQSSTLPAAVATGNLTLRPFSIVTKIIYDKNLKKATGVEILDAETNKTYTYNAKIIFVCASTLNSAWLLMNSATDVWPDGLGSSSGELGHNIMDHHFKVGASGKIDGYEDLYVYGRKPNGIYIPRFRNINGDKRQYLRGFGYQGGASRAGWGRNVAELNIGADYKDALTVPGGWGFGATAFGEILPYHDNRMYLNKDKKDKWGLPVIEINAAIKENEKLMRVDMANDMAEMLDKAGFKNISTYDADYGFGSGIHEMGTARMGRDPKTSVLNANNQVWDCKNVFVTDGSCMTSAACVNPSLTYMALTARAADFAVNELKKQNL